jgi:rod shape-determining protein MreD
MNNWNWFTYGIHFIVILLLQVLVINYFEVSIYVYPMVYVMLILILPPNFTTIQLLMVAFFLGFMIDSMSNSFGLHTSALLITSYLRPLVLNLIRPIDGYDRISRLDIHQTETIWFFQYTMIMLLIHHFWFFTLEVFRLDMIGRILIQTIISSLVCYFLIVILQYVLFKPLKQ